MSVDDAVAVVREPDGPLVVADPRPPEADATPGPSLPPAPSPQPARRLARIIGGWAVSVAVGALVVLYLVSPLFQQRDQHRLLSAYRTLLTQSSLEATGLFGFTLPTRPPATGSTVGIVEVGRLHLQEAVTEGVGPAQTEDGPGHVPGTAGLGQPGNSAVVGRRAMFGGPFARLSALRRGDPIVVTTVEGQSLYVVTQVRSETFGSAAAVDAAYGTSAGNHLTLVTSRSDLPWSRLAATVVVATMRTQPFTPTPQQSRRSGQDGRSGAAGAWAPFVLALEAFAGVAVGAMILYRRTSVRTAYLLSAAPLVVATILVAVAGLRLLPAWT